MKKREKILFCGNAGCCPSIKYTGKEVLIEDDFKNKVRLSVGNWNQLVKSILEGKLDTIPEENYH